MRIGRAFLFLVMVAALTLWAVPGRAEDALEAKKEEKKTDPNMWSPPEQVGDSRRMRLSEEEITRIMERIKTDDPKKAKELENLRTLDEEKFRRELREYGREEFSKIVRERIDEYRRRRRDEFLKWLEEQYQGEAKELAKFKDKDADVYNKRYDFVWKKYGYIHDAWRTNAELGEVLKQDLSLKNRRDYLLAKLKNEKEEGKKNELLAQLKEVTEDRFDLIVRRKQIAYDDLLKKIKELQDRINEQKSEIRKWRDKNFKEENVKQRLKELTEGVSQFNWN